VDLPPYVNRVLSPSARPSPRGRPR
jgi:hypothetical protein